MRKGGFETLTLDDYEITENGEIFNIKWGKRKLTPQPNGKGYLRVHIAGKRYFVHRLVAEKYIPNPDNKSQVNHKDGNKLNNCVENLEWVTNQENRNHAVLSGLQSSKLCVEDVKFIREHTELSQSKLSDMFNVSKSTIQHIRCYKSWKNS